MNFQALLISKDEQATATLSSAFGSFDVDVQRCGNSEAVVRLTEQRFDTVVVDFDDPHSAIAVLQNASMAGRRAVTVALLTDQSKVRKVFGAGANFVLYKPVAQQQAHATLRAVTALIKRERRRSFRVPVQVAVQLDVQDGQQMEGILLDLSEEGIDVLAAQPLCPSAVVRARFTLLDGTELDLRGEVAWANPNGQSGVRLVDLSEKTRATLRSWVAANAPELPPEDPTPVAQCKLTDLSVGACYVETESPFPERSGILLVLKVKRVEVQAEGVVRAMHPGFGMGIEFCLNTPEQRQQVENFIAVLMHNPGVAPELSITPRALRSAEASRKTAAVRQDVEDSLLELLHNSDSLSQEEFLDILQNQRHSEVVS
jgi:DNA-binding response OmpR family regulator